MCSTLPEQAYVQWELNDSRLSPCAAHLLRFAGPCLHEKGKKRATLIAGRCPVRDVEHYAPQEPVLFDEVCDRLPAVQPTGEHGQYHLQHGRVDHEAELISRAGLKDIGRSVEHYGIAAA
jgi:hypothetical protein